MKFALAFSALAASTAVTALYIPEPKIKEPVYTVELAPGETRQVTESEKWELLGQGKHFIDITDYQHIDSRRVQVSAVAFPASVAHEDVVKPLITKLSANNIYSKLEKYTSFNNRYYKSATGKEAAEWLLQQVQDIISGAGGNSTRVAASVKPFVHPSWGQNSVIATIPGKSANTIVVGSHLDSVNQRNPTNGRAPGADDNGSGSMTILETLRVLLSDPEVAAGQAPNTIEFHWYAAEEAGLLGSQAIFAAYKKEGRQVKAMLNQDMTGYVQGTLAANKPEAMGVVTDNVDKNLTAFIKKVIAAYCAIPAVDTRCGYACSDHASANRNGYPSAFVIESAMEHSSDFIHGTGDTIDTVSAEHMLEHAKMSLGFAYELGYAEGL
ncbi:Leucine aminopeptidase 1 [Orbilia oligospora]|uniref:Peptide hydrolase n=1 Tax=Orbilia oligospora TaxID=2813651 RepID=A0A7C8P306_ORBOL|nr:Leucine aminopeptidase 1 [Orbilia oligospora]KAF3165017.1 Leucine aminopeptidase 1 [Orbilia oligospora]KAF3258487.1 Leucine aminopeptidase 1 [Orbilia oligospora]KAF3271169.1 Leucine aminopeptidase 1 [Orbilia oligospora]KAF3282146.1 Leucine aminopeptidase 1 [Orbilia oligospora]